MSELIIPIKEKSLLDFIFGNLDEVANIIENTLDISLYYKHSNLYLRGESAPIDIAKQVIEQLHYRIEKGDEVDIQGVHYILEKALEKSDIKRPYYDTVIMTTHKGDSIVPKSHMQENYVKAIATSDIVFGLGPAGTGKTFIAVTMALKALKEKRVDKIVITRPAVEAGEHLGFLPGDLQKKIEPYLKPIDDALSLLLGQSLYTSYWDKGIIEMIPLAYMRGRTLERAFIILDEAQNTSIDQMKMFLTRFGKHSKVVVNGDTSQVDLNDQKKSGLIHASTILLDIEGISIITFDKSDVIRHQLVKKIIEAYNQDLESRGSET